MDWIAEILVRQGGSNGYLEIWKWCAYLNTLKALLKVRHTLRNSMPRVAFFIVQGKGKDKHNNPKFREKKFSNKKLYKVEQMLIINNRLTLVSLSH